MSFKSRKLAKRLTIWFLPALLIGQFAVNHILPGGEMGVHAGLGNHMEARVPVDCSACAFSIQITGQAYCQVDVVIGNTAIYDHSYTGECTRENQQCFCEFSAWW